MVGPIGKIQISCDGQRGSTATTRRWAGRERGLGKDSASNDARSKARSRSGGLYDADCSAARTAAATHTTSPCHNTTTARNRGAHREPGRGRSRARPR
jgi:hypothetical protein